MIDRDAFFKIRGQSYLGIWMAGFPTVLFIAFLTCIYRYWADWGVSNLAFPAVSINLSLTNCPKSIVSKWIASFRLGYTLCTGICWPSMQTERFGAAQCTWGVISPTLWSRKAYLAPYKIHKTTHCSSTPSNVWGEFECWVSECATRELGAI